MLKNLENLKISWFQLEEIKQEIEKEMKEFKSELVQDCSNCESSCSLSKNDEATVKNLNNKTLLDMLDMENLEMIESKLTVMATGLNSFNRELTNLFKFSKDNITETDLECVCSNYNLILDKLSNETRYLKELCNHKNRNEPDFGKKTDLIDQNSIDCLQNLNLDLNINKILDYNELMTSTPRNKQSENKTNMLENKKNCQEMNIKDKSCQTDKISKNNQIKYEDSGINAIQDSTDYGYFTKLESSTDNVYDFNNSDIKRTEKLNCFKKDPDFLNENVRKRYVEKFDKIDEDQCTEPETQIHDNGESISTDVESKFSFYKILLSGFFFALIFVFFVYSVMPKIMPSCCDFKRDYLFFNVRSLFDDDDDRYTPF